MRGPGVVRSAATNKAPVDLSSLEAKGLQQLQERGKEGWAKGVYTVHEEVRRASW